MFATLVLTWLGVSSAFGAERVAVTVGIEPQLWLVERIGGFRVDAAALVRPGESPETFQPSDAEVARTLRSRLYLCLGLPFESGPWFAAVRGSHELRLVDLRRGITLLPGAQPPPEGPCSYRPGTDPHTWLSPRLLSLQADNLAAALANADPEGSLEYEAGRKRVQAELAALGEEIAGRLAPLRGKSFFVEHPTWGYLAAEHGLEQVAIEDEGKAPSDREMTVLARRMRESGARVILVGPSRVGRGARALSEVTGARLRVVDPLAFDLPTALRAFVSALEEGVR